MKERVSGPRCARLIARDFARIKAPMPGEPNDRFLSKECLSAGGGALDEHDYLRRPAETMVASSALRERLKKRARSNDAQLSWRQRRGRGGVSRYNSSVAQCE
jgi:hypothetical protein